MSRIASVARAGYWPTPPRVADLVATWLAPPPPAANRQPVLLDPCAGEGEAIARLAGTLSGVAHAIELNAARAERCRERVPGTRCADALEVTVEDDGCSLLLLNESAVRRRPAGCQRPSGRALPDPLPAGAGDRRRAGLHRPALAGGALRRATGVCLRPATAAAVPAAGGEGLRSGRRPGRQEAGGAGRRRGSAARRCWRPGRRRWRPTRCRRWRPVPSECRPTPTRQAGCCRRPGGPVCGRRRRSGTGCCRPAPPGSRRR